jgi:hypothetical protein
MHFIEQWFQASPDNGSGAIEVAYLATVALLAVAVSSRRYMVRLVKWCRPLLKKS